MLGMLTGLLVARAEATSWERRSWSGAVRLGPGWVWCGPSWSGLDPVVSGPSPVVSGLDLAGLVWTQLVWSGCVRVCVCVCQGFRGVLKSQKKSTIRKSTFKALKSLKFAELFVLGLK